MLSTLRRFSQRVAVGKHRASFTVARTSFNVPMRACASTGGSVVEPETRTFQAETKQLLDIVTNALYSDKHIFVRELISNASDALEKARHREAAGSAIHSPGTEHRVDITADEKAGKLIIHDTGIGMTHDELIENLGTIAKSGSKAFLQQLQAAGSGEMEATHNIIGQFGVGFYSAFMVGDEVRVISQSAEPDAPAHVWTSKGDGAYTLQPYDMPTRGTRIEITLKPDCQEFATAARLKEIIEKYSSFVNYPIHLNGKHINTVQALWTKKPSEITEDLYNKFYKYISKSFDKPSFRLHFQSDAPIELKALFFIGQSHKEKEGMGRQPSGVSLYSRKVLIEPESSILPPWLRFVHGVVDSEDLPLNVSRESMQDSSLYQRIRSVLTRRFLRFLDQESKRDREKFQQFSKEFGHFLKEGIVTDVTFQQDIAKLLRFESSSMPSGQLTSFDEYISRMEPGQDKIYFVVAPTRAHAESSPYMEAFNGDEAKGDSPTEVLFLYTGIDDFVMHHLYQFNSRRIISIESSDVDVKSLSNKKSDSDKPDAAQEAADAAASMTSEEVSAFGKWLQEVLPGRLREVRASERLKASPAVVTDHESAPLRRMMRALDQSKNDGEATRMEDQMLPPQVLEVNPRHPVIQKLHRTSQSSPVLAQLAAEQLLDNALIVAGLLEDSRTMVPRLNKILEEVLSSGKSELSAADVAGLPAAEASDAKREAVKKHRAAVDSAAMDAAMDLKAKHAASLAAGQKTKK